MPIFKAYLGACALAAIALAAPAQATWYEASTDHFTVYSERSEKAARAQATNLERFDLGLRILRGVPDKDSDKSNPVVVYVVANSTAVQRLCVGGGKARKGCVNVAGFYVARAGNSVVFTPVNTGDGGKYDLNPQIVLFHEYTHHFMFENFPSALPAWLSEGYAEFHSTATFAPDGTIGFGNPAYHRAYGLAENTLSMTKILSSSTADLKAWDEDMLYGRGWLLLHYLTFDKVRAGQLAKYFDGLNRGEPNLDAATKAFGDLKKLDKDLNAYLAKPTMSYVAIKVPQIAPGAIRIRILSPGESAMMPVRMRSKRGVTGETAQAVLADARTTAAPFQDDPAVQGALAEAEYDAGNDDLAEAAADRGLAKAPNDRVGLIYKGMVHSRRAAKASSTDAATWKEARSWYVRANKLDPNYAEPLMLYYMSFLQARQKPTTNAIAALQRAFEVSPQDTSLRFMYARQKILDDQLPEARVALGPIAYDPHAPRDNLAARLIALIDAGDKAGLHALMEKKQDDADDS